MAEQTSPADRIDETEQVFDAELRTFLKDVIETLAPHVAYMPEAGRLIAEARALLAEMEE